MKEKNSISLYSIEKLWGDKYTDLHQKILIHKICYNLVSFLSHKQPTSENLHQEFRIVNYSNVGKIYINIYTLEH